ncbi:ATP-binding protein [Marinobacter adhaerens]|jgi:PAS domain S-box-containing protein|uniref:PAS domain-containing sensor histidine kinase n=1 Tax=Marinobacter adhaerens TaxID=1033846 RepID=UPI001E573CFF|nr:ATP-binding protein [Marinobacter adhaerens]MCD1646508.1 PAS domain-containing protein [Marinobacter adhaerens]
MHRLLSRLGALRFAVVYIAVATIVGILLEFGETYFEPQEQVTVLDLADTFMLISITAVALYFLLQALLGDNQRQRLRRQKTQQAYQQLFRAHPQPMFLYNPANRRILDANDAAVSRYGWSREEFRQMRADDVQWKSDGEDLDAYFNSLPDNNRPQHIGAQRQVNRSGAPFWAEVTTYPVNFDNMFMQLVTCVDISVQVEAAQKASKALKHLEDAEKLGKFGAWEWHPGEDRMRISRGLARLFGIPLDQKEELLSSAFQRILPEDRSRARAAAEWCLETGDAEVQFRAMLANGEIRHYREILHTQAATDSGFIVTGSIIDETGQIKYTRYLERQESDLHKILTSMPAPVVLHEPDAEGRIHMANPAFYCMLGVPASEEPSIRNLCQLGAGHEDRRLLEDLFQPAVSGVTNTRKCEVILKRRNGSVFRVHILALRLKLTDRSLIQLVIHDMDDEIVLREQLRHANDNLSKLNSKTLKVLEQERALLSRELHDDIGQLLIAAKTNLRSLYNKWPAGESKPEEVELISGVLEELVAKVRDRSLMLRPPQLDELGLKHAITWEMRRVMGPTKIRSRFHDKVVLDKLPPEPSITAFRIFQEAMTNAVRHGDPEHLEVTLETDSHELRLTIEDDGQGFHPEQQRNGLGLANIKERASLVTGEVRINSTPGQGTRIEARLPLSSHN